MGNEKVCTRIIMQFVFERKSQKEIAKNGKIGHRNEQIARIYKWFTGCVKFDKE